MTEWESQERRGAYGAFKVQACGAAFKVSAVPLICWRLFGFQVFLITINRYQTTVFLNHGCGNSPCVCFAAPVFEHQTRYP
jgi:hypothetical protein